MILIQSQLLVLSDENNKLKSDNQNLESTNEGLTKELTQLKLDLMKLKTNKNEESNNLNNEKEKEYLEKIEESNKKIKDLEFENKSKEETITMLKNDNKKVTSQIILEQTKNKIKMETLEKQVNTLNENIKQNEEELDKKNNLIEELEIQVKRSKLEMDTIQKKVKEQTETIKKSIEKTKNDSENQTKILNDQITNLKNEKVVFSKEKEALQLEIKALQQAINSRAEEDIRKQEQMEKLLNKGYDEKDNLDELRKKNLNLRMQLMDSQNTILRAKDCIKKAQYFDNMTKYGKILMRRFQPSNFEEQEAINKLTSMFNGAVNSSKNYQGFDKNDFNYEGVEKKKGIFGIFG
jgi:chromosome segregation protein